MEDDILKCDGQYPKLVHMLAILMKLLRHVLSLTITLRCFHNNLSSPSSQSITAFCDRTLKLFNRKRCPNHSDLRLNFI